MGRNTLTGSRIRERRLIAGIRQADLARRVGISASYLNLIEHNRRRIGGKLLIDIARQLEVEPTMLSEGAEAALIATLREAAADTAITIAEVDRADEFAGRFPGWAEVLVAMHRRAASLERTVEILSDRLTHDPHLAASLHEVLSTAAAIRSTASILVETEEIEPEWRDRFHRNLNQDAERLAESSKALVGYLDDSGEGDDRRRAPQEEVEAYLGRQGHHFEMLEQGSNDVESLARGAPELTSAAARHIARGILTQYASDARAMPLDRFRRAIAESGADPMALARGFGVELPAVFRRLAAMPEGELPVDVGLVVCDASGSILFRKPVGGFALPRFGAACPRWPLFAALSRPMTPIRQRLAQLGRGVSLFDAFVIAHPVGLPDFGRDPVYHSTMLIIPQPGPAEADATARPVGSTCRVCPRDACSARREPSILSEGF